MILTKCIDKQLTLSINKHFNFEIHQQMLKCVDIYNIFLTVFTFIQHIKFLRIHYIFTAYNSNYIKHIKRYNGKAWICLHSNTKNCVNKICNYNVVHNIIQLHYHPRQKLLSHEISTYGCILYISWDYYFSKKYLMVDLIR